MNVQDFFIVWQDIGLILYSVLKALLGPAPASVAKINDRYRYRLTLAAQNTKEIRAMVAHLVRCAQTDKENKGVSVSADVNPLD